MFVRGHRPRLQSAAVAISNCVNPSMGFAEFDLLLRLVLSFAVAV